MPGPTLPTLASATAGTGAWTDISSLGQLKAQAAADGKAALPAVAKQFEGVFIEMLIHSMRQADFGGGIFDSQEMHQWQGLFDQQIALSLANDGSGIGIAAMLERQLGGGTRTGNGAAGAAPGQGVAAQNLDQDLTRSGTTPPATLLGRITQNAERGLNALEQWAQGAVHDIQGSHFSGPDDFVRKLAPYARKAAQALGVSVRAVLAQAALETNWGQRLPRRPDGQSSHNLFGIKAGAGWDGPSAPAATLEYVGSRPVASTASFRAYADPAQSFVDYVKVLSSSPRYASALGSGQDVAAFAGALARGGYASDPAYARKLTAIADGSKMRHALALVKSSDDRPIP